MRNLHTRVYVSMQYRWGGGKKAVKERSKKKKENHENPPFVFLFVLKTFTTMLPRQPSHSGMAVFPSPVVY